ncbi:MAG TPA: hypothetical protein VF155_08370 [Candidatus Dormibacteraeota bacterium]
MVAAMAIAVAVLLILEVVLLRRVLARRRIPVEDAAAVAENGRQTALLACFVALLAAVLLITLLRLLAQAPGAG